jgi:hypothetical protein
MGIKAGCDLNDGDTYAGNGAEAISQGLMTEADVDTALSRV